MMLRWRAILQPLSRCCSSCSAGVAEDLAVQRFDSCPQKQHAASGLVGFYYPGRKEPCDQLCGAGFLGNFFPASVRVKAFSFANAEAAFQALKFWELRQEFKSLSGDDAFRLKRRLSGKEDWTYAGYGSNWKGMKDVLRNKFQPGSDMAAGLLATGDAFLLEHNSVPGRDKVWSDNYDGEGTNWLGLQLMLLRGELLKQDAKSCKWSATLHRWFDSETGNARTPEYARLWQETVRSASQELEGHIRHS